MCYKILSDAAFSLLACTLLAGEVARADVPSCTTMSPATFHKLRFLDPAFVAPECLRPDEFAAIWYAKQRLIAAGAEPPCGSPAALPDDVRDSLREDGVLSGEDCGRISTERLAELAERGLLPRRNVWKMSAEEKDELVRQGVHVPRSREELPAETRDALIRAGALPRMSFDEARANGTLEELAVRGVVNRFSKYTRLMVGFREFCAAFHASR